LTSLSNEYSSSYYDAIDKYTLAIISLVVFFSSIFIYKFNPNKSIWIHLLVFLLLPNLYGLYYLNITENFSSSQSENDRLKFISDGIMSICFLATVNIYIITELSKSSKTFSSLFLESIVIFSVSLLFLFSTIYKRTNFNNLEQMRSIRVTKQLTFNLVIYYNTFIIFNYLLFISNKFKI